MVASSQSLRLRMERHRQEIASEAYEAQGRGAFSYDLPLDHSGVAVRAQTVMTLPERADHVPITPNLGGDRRGLGLGKDRSPASVLGLSIITFGIYYIVWYYKINNEIRHHDPDIDVLPGWAAAAISVGAVLFFIPPIVSSYATAARIRQMQLDDGAAETISPVVALLLFIFLGIGYPLYVASQLREHWHGHRRAVRSSNKTSFATVIPSATYLSGLTDVKKARGNLCFDSQYVGIGRSSPFEAMVAWTDLGEILITSTSVDACILTLTLREGTEVDYRITGTSGSEVQSFLEPLLAPWGIISDLDGISDEEDSEDTDYSYDDELRTRTSLPDLEEPSASTETSVTGLADQIARLGALRKDGTLTDEEFALAKANLLSH